MMSHASDGRACSKTEFAAYCGDQSPHAEFGLVDDGRDSAVYLPIHRFAGDDAGGC